MGFKQTAEHRYGKGSFHQIGLVRGQFGNVDEGKWLKFVADTGFDGWEVARQLCRQRLKRRPLLVAVTGYGQAEDQRRTQEAGFDAHLIKPVDLQRLTEILASLAVRN